VLSGPHWGGEPCTSRVDCHQDTQLPKASNKFSTSKMQCRDKNEKIGMPTAKNLRIAAFFFFLAASCLGAQPGNPGRGNIPGNTPGNSPNGPPGPEGNPNNQRPALNTPGAVQTSLAGLSHGDIITTIGALPAVSQKALVGVVAPSIGTIGALPTLTARSQIQLVGAIITDTLDSGTLGSWAAGSGSRSEPQGAAYDTWSAVLGIVHPLSQHIVVGAAGGYAHTWSDSIAVNSGFGSLYGAWLCNGWYFDEAVYGGGQSFRTTRESLFGTVHGEGKGFMFGSISSAGYNWTLGPWKIGPVAGIAYSLSATNAWDERDDVLPFHVQSSTQQAFGSELGIKSSFKIKFLTVSTKLAWDHDFARTSVPSVVSIVGLPSSTSTVYGPSLGHDALIVDGGISFQLTKKLSIGASYHGEMLRSNYRANAAVASVKLEF